MSTNKVYIYIYRLQNHILLAVYIQHFKIFLDFLDMVCESHCTCRHCFIVNTSYFIWTFFGSTVQYSKVFLWTTSSIKREKKNYGRITGELREKNGRKTGFSHQDRYVPRTFQWRALSRGNVCCWVYIYKHVMDKIQKNKAKH